MEAANLTNGMNASAIVGDLGVGFAPGIATCKFFLLDFRFVTV